MQCICRHIALAPFESRSNILQMLGFQTVCSLEQVLCRECHICGRLAGKCERCTIWRCWQFRHGASSAIRMSVNLRMQNSAMCEKARKNPVCSALASPFTCPSCSVSADGLETVVFRRVFHLGPSVFGECHDRQVPARSQKYHSLQDRKVAPRLTLFHLFSSSSWGAACIGLIVPGHV